MCGGGGVSKPILSHETKALDESLQGEGKKGDGV